MSDNENYNYLSQLLSQHHAYIVLKPDEFEREQNTVSEESLSASIRNILLKLGIPPHVKGFIYLHNAILQSAENPDIFYYITKDLYPDIAKYYHTTTDSVERAIRHSIKLAFDRIQAKTFPDYCDFWLTYIHKKPSNSQFIALVIQVFFQ